jgi:PAS domain S-box-containing protein
MGQKLFPFERRPVFLVSLLLSFVVIFGVACIVAYKSYTKAIDATIRSNETRATLLAKLILEHQRAAIGVLQSYADRPLLVASVKKRDFEGTLKHLIDLAKQNPEMDWPFISNPDSTVWVNYPVDRQVMNKDLTYRDWYKGISKGWKPYISGVYKLIVGDKDLAVAVSAPILDEKGKVIGVLSTAQSTAFFREIIGEVGLNRDAKITLIDQEGHIIYSNGFPYTKEIIGYPSFEVVRRAMKGEKGNVEARDVPDGGRIKYVSFAPVEGIGWSIIVEKTKSEVLRSEYFALVLIGVISLLIYGISVLFLVHSRERHRHIRRLEKLNEELDGLVRERTTELEAANQSLNREIIERKRTEETLRESEARYRSLFNGMTEGFALHEVICDENGAPCDYRFLEINPAFEQLTGLKREDVIGKTMIQVLPNDDPKWVKIYGEVALTGKSIHFENYSPVLKRYYEVFAYCPAPHRFGVLFMDITDRKRTEEALRESEERLRRFYESGLLGVIYWNMNGEVTDANDKFLEMVGYDREDLTSGRIDWRRMTPPEHRQQDENSAAELKATGVNKTPFEKEYIRKDGTRIPTIVAGAMLDEARFNGVAFVLDITERKRAEEALRLAYSRLQTFFDHRIGGIGIAIANAGGDILQANDYYLGILGFTREELLSGHVDWRRMTPPEWLPADEHNLKQLRERGVCDTYEKEYVRRDGSRVPVLITDAMMPGDSGDILAFVLDVTDRKRAEKALKQRTLELQQLTDTLEERVKERTAELASLSSELLVAQEKERRRISYDLHDNVWQTLEIIKSQVEHLFSMEGEADWAGFHRKAKQLIPVIRDTVARVRSMQGDLWPSVLDDIGILATLDWYCREFGINHPGLGIERNVGLLEEEVPASTKIVIYRVMQEALSNVAKHSQASRVSLSLVKSDHRLEFIIRDNGIGFDPQEAIVKRNPWGGLGLLSMKERTELSGGLFGVESAKGKGTVVRVSWPVNESH